MKLKILSAALVSFVSVFGACNRGKKDVIYFPLPNKSVKVVHSESQSFMVDTVLTGLTRPYSMAFLPEGKVLITERGGKLWIVKGGQVPKKKRIRGNVPDGLRDIELHPQYEENGWIYLSYYVEPDNEAEKRTVLMRGRLDGDMLVDTKVLYNAGPFEEVGEWFGSRIEFDREGYLLFTVGQRDGKENPQNLSRYSGKIMRLYEDGRIPPDNPFVDTSGALPEIYTYGHREPEGLVRHPETGVMWSHEHGPMGGDEINIIRAGLNYGWPEVTYGLNYDSTYISKDTLRKGMEAPVHQWTPSIAPSGLDFITGTRYPAWKGNLFTGSLKFRFLNRSVIEDNKVVHEERLLEGIGRIRSIRFAPDKLLYVLTEDTGLMVRLIPVK